MNNVQKEFEDWVKNETCLSLFKYGNGVYMDNDTYYAFDVWESSRKNITIELPENCKGKALTVDELKVMLDKVGIGLKGG
jgi:hypothetical protein